MKTMLIELTIEMAREIVITKPERLIAWCVGCDKEVHWMTMDEAARFAGASLREVIRIVEDGELHCAETRDGSLIVCPDSLIRARSGSEWQNTPTRRLEI